MPKVINMYTWPKKNGSENEAVVNKHIITTGMTQGSIVEVLSGIADGDQLIKEGARTVKDGQKVQILNSK